MSHFLDEPDQLRSLEIPDAEVYWCPTLLLPKSNDLIVAELIATLPWRSEAITMFGKSHLQPRLLAWFGDAGARYTYSGVEHAPLPWTDLLVDVRNKIQQVTGESFNSVLANYYRDERDSMGFHSDDEPELGPAPVIASYSVGEVRTFILKHRRRRDLKPIRIKLGSGSLLLMKGETQKNWRHAVPKETRPCGPRVNLTFRQIHTNRLKQT